MNTFSDPKKITEQFPVEENFHIADFGCGAGAYSLALAEKISDQGKVFAIDIQQNMIDRLQNHILAENIKKIHVIWGDVDEPKGSRLRDESVDLVLLANVLFQVENKKTMLQEAFRVLKKDARIVLIDWSESFGNIGPKEDHVVKESTAKLLIEESGFEFEKGINAGEHHYGFIARKL